MMKTNSDTTSSLYIVGLGVHKEKTSVALPPDSGIKGEVRLHGKVAATRIRPSMPYVIALWASRLFAIA